jgi:hypothetical protein
MNRSWSVRALLMVALSSAVLSSLGTSALTWPDEALATFPMCDNPAQHSSYSVGSCAASGQWVTYCFGSGWFAHNAPRGGAHHSYMDQGINKQRYKWVTAGASLSAPCSGTGFTTWSGLLGNNGAAHGWVHRTYVIL